MKERATRTIMNTSDCGDSYIYTKRSELKTIIQQEHTTEPTNFMEQLQKLNKEMYEETNHNKNKTRESGLKEFYRRSPDLLILLSIWNAFHTPPARTAIKQNAERSVSSPRCTVQRNSKQNRKANRVPIEIIS